MSKDFLSQEEVDALLKGVTGENEEAREEAAPATSGPRPYNLAAQERVVRGRMPTLELLNERFAQRLRIGLFNFMRRTPKIAVGPVRTVKFGEFIGYFPVPAALNLVQARPLRGTALVIFDADLVFLVVNNLFGGSGELRSRVEGRDFTPTEQRIIERMLAIVFEDLENSWRPVREIKFEYVRSEVNAQFANVAAPDEIAVVTTYSIAFGNAGGELHVCMPYSMLEPIRDLLSGSRQVDHMEVDKRWTRLLSSQVQSAEVELTVNLGHARLTFNQLLGMQVGDVISLDIPQPMIAEIDGVPVMECRCGLFNGQYALRVEKMIAGARQEAA